MVSRSSGVVLTVALLVSIFAPAWAQVRLTQFSVAQEGDTVELVLTLSAPVNVSEDEPCVLNKFIFVDSINPNTRRLEPMYGGTCTAVTMSPTVTASLDIRDFSAALTAGVFTSASSSIVITKPGTEANFLPGVNLVPITTPLMPNFTSYTGSPRLIGFDVDLASRRLLLHFSDIMSLTGFRSTAFTFQSDATSTQFHTLTSDSRPVGISTNNIKTICVTLSTADLTALNSRSICTTAERCYCRFTNFLGLNYNDVAVVASTNAIQVTNLVQRLPATAPPSIYMELSLSYVDKCLITRLLEPDEVYFVRRGEYVNSVTCNVTQGMWPILTHGVSSEMYTPQGLSRTQDSSSLSVTNGFSSDMLGLYTCATADNMIQHFIVPEVPSFLGLPNGPEYSIRLYDSLTIPFFFGSNPQIDFMAMSAEIVWRQLQGTPLKEPVSRKLSSFRGEIYFDIAPYSLTSNFQLSVISSEITNPMTTLIIVINAPEIYTIPGVVGLLSTDTDFKLQCVARNSLVQPRLFWVPGPSNTPVSSSSSLTEQVSSRKSQYTCTLRDPEDLNRIAVEVPVYVKAIPWPLSVFNNGNIVNDTAEFEVRNQFTPTLTLQCIGHAPSSVNDVMWVSQKAGELPVELQPDMNNDQIQVWYSSNVANITIVNFVEPYRGLLRCQSRRSGRQATFYLVETLTVGTTTTGCPRDVDKEWGIIWETTRTGSTGSQPCPQINGSYTGFAYRQCNSDRKWGSSVNVSRCNSAIFTSLSSDIDDFVGDFESMSLEARLATLENLITMVQMVIAPRNFSLFPQELTTSVSVIERLTNVLVRVYGDQQYTNMDLVSTFDTLLATSNAPGWRELNEMNREAGGLALLDTIQDVFTRYVYLVLEGETSFVRGDNLYMSVVKVLNGVYIIFPNDSDSRAREAQIRIPISEVMSKNATGTVNYAIKNIASFLPSPPPTNNSDVVTEAVSTLLSSILYPSWLPLERTTSQRIQLKFLTYRVLRGSNPRCAYWNSATSSWDDTGVWTVSVKRVEIEEYKSFEVECSSNTTSPQAIIVDRPKSISPYAITTAAYVGSGFILFFISMTMFLFLTSCVFGKDLTYYVSSYLVHLSFCASTIAAFVVFLVGAALGPAGATQGHTDGTCTLISVLLHYFFTASFTWLLCVAVILTAFKWVSTHSWSFIIFFFIGWGLPVIPVAISVGALTDLYTSTSFCWFYFDGEISSRIFLSFWIPKLLIVVAILVLFPISLIIACRIKFQKMEGETNLPVYLVMVSWFGLLVQLILFSASWVFLMLHVNNYGPNYSGWIFAGVSIALGIWILVIGLFIVLINQRTDYESFWAVFAGGQTLERPKKSAKEVNKDDIPLEDNMFTPSEKDDTVPLEEFSPDSFIEDEEEEQQKSYID